ncbi:high-affinity iron transporter [Jatrophihabitans sp. GAS493]|uniref:iron uptake transporter permease EfeU n=1 Tax=Jatrophihabitans sp. GAS493 TaxID=1907575 RepID=UPI000BB9025B|nr:iron uptake transporter permease EfeU [Jatrophihabitans sp. GAS493]SOD72686.1 high-affinity iron transporter [Jatrophihabitans sp. GAS493]
MLPTFVIGLREGLEAALIVGIVAAFLRQRERRDLLRWVWIGVLAATLLCIAGGVALRVFSQNLPQRQQEGLETVIGLVAVAMVTYMVVWMRRNSRSLKGQLEGAAAEALAEGSGWALVVMAFLAVLREGFETSVFLLAAYNESDNGATATTGAVLGIAVAVAIGYGIYRGGVKLNLSRFFRITGVMLVLVSAGLVVSALHTAHEAGWLNFGQHQVLDLSALVTPGTVQESLLTGMLGIQARPVFIELTGWLLYVIPVGIYVGWPPGRALSNRIVVRISAGIAAVAAVAALLLVVLAPAKPAFAQRSAGAQQSAPGAAGGQNSASLGSPGQPQSPYTAVVGSGADAHRLSGNVQLVGPDSHESMPVEVYQGRVAVLPAAGRPSSLSYAEIAKLNGGSLPFGVRAKAGEVAVNYADTAELTLWVEPHTGQVIDAQVQQKTVITPSFSVGVAQLAPQTTTTRWPSVVTVAQADQARQAVSDLNTRRLLLQVAASLAVVAVVGTLVALWFAFVRRRPTSAAPSSVTNPKPELVRS